MNEPLADSELEHLLNFVGYGRLDAEAWFMGLKFRPVGEKRISVRG